MTQNTKLGASGLKVMRPYLQTETENKVIEWCILFCPKCKKKIRGRTWAHVKSNLNEHMRKHRRNKK